VVIILALEADVTSVSVMNSQLITACPTMGRFVQSLWWLY